MLNLLCKLRECEGVAVMAGLLSGVAAARRGRRLDGSLISQENCFRNSGRLLKGNNGRGPALAVLSSSASSVCLLRVSTRILWRFISRYLQPFKRLMSESERDKRLFPLLRFARRVA